MICPLLPGFKKIRRGRHQFSAAHLTDMKVLELGVKTKLHQYQFFSPYISETVYHRNADMTLATGKQNVALLLIILNKDLHYTELLYIANFKIKK